MLKKLMRYEWLATSRMILPFYIVMLSVAIINGIFFRLDRTDGVFHNIAEKILISSYIIIIIASFLFVIYIMVSRFYKNIYGREGYLTHTLPVKNWQHIVSKLVAASCWSIATMIVFFTSLFVLGLIVAPEEFYLLCYKIVSEWKRILMILSESEAIVFGVQVVVSAILGTISFYLKAYFSIGVGQLVSNYRILASIAVYIGIGVIENIVSATISIPIFMKINTVTDDASVTKMLHSIFNHSIFYSLIFAILYFLGTKYLMDKKLNL